MLSAVYKSALVRGSSMLSSTGQARDRQDSSWQQRVARLTELIVAVIHVSIETSWLTSTARNLLLSLFHCEHAICRHSADCPALLLFRFFRCASIAKPKGPYYTKKARDDHELSR